MLAAILCSPPPAFAQEPVLPRPLLSHGLEKPVTAYYAEHGLPLDTLRSRVAAVDLNNDGLDEAFVFSADGTVTIMAIPVRGKAMMLGQIDKPTGVVLSDRHDFGVRQIIALGSPTNDFTRQTYRWNPQTRQYAPDAAGKAE